FWSACQEGVSGVGPIRSFDASTYPVKIAGEVRDFDVSAYLPDEHKKSQKVMSRATKFAVGAAGLAIRDAGFSPDCPAPTLAGGADSRIDPLMLLAYSALGAVSHSGRPASEVSRPFDRRRDGFVLGEGAGVLLLEELGHAKRRGAHIYAEVLGFGSSFDAFS